MPDKRDSDISSPAAKQTRVRKPRTAASAKSKAKSKPKAAAAKSAGKTAKPRRRTRTKAAAASPTRNSAATGAGKPAAAKQAKPQSDELVIDQSSQPVMQSTPAPKLPVSPRKPAAADASSNAPSSAAPVPESRWSWAGAPIAATVAFLATLGALLLGYWTGYAVGGDAVGETALTVASAAEKTPRNPVAAPASLFELPVVHERNIAEAPEAVESPESLEPLEAVEPAAPEAAAESIEQGLHLQVSALSSERAASTLRRQLESKGFPVRVDPPAEDDLVRVYVGPIADGEDLDEWAGALRKEGLKPFPKRL